MIFLVTKQEIPYSTVDRYYDHENLNGFRSQLKFHFSRVMKFVAYAHNTCAETKHYIACKQGTNVKYPPRSYCWHVKFV